MKRTLDEVKRHLSRKYLGRAGIHGMGVSRAKNAVNVYLSPQGAGKEQEELLEEIEKEAAPYEVIKVESDQPSLT